MRTSIAGLELIKLYEGCKLKAYKCPAGVWTIGYGHTKTAKEGMTITMAKATSLLAQDLSRFEDYITAQFSTINFEQYQFDALVSFCYNLGSIKGTVRAGIIFKDRLKTVKGLAMYVKAGGKYLLGLHRRRLAEALLFSGVTLTAQETESIRHRYTTDQINAHFDKLEKDIISQGTK